MTTTQTIPESAYAAALVLLQRLEALQPLFPDAGGGERVGVRSAATATRDGEILGTVHERYERAELTAMTTREA